MAAPTWAQVWVQVQNVVKLVEDARVNLSGAFLTQVTAILAGINLDSFNTTSEGGGVGAVRGRASNLVDGSSSAAVISPLVVELGRIMKSPEKDVPTLLVRLTRYMVDDPDALGSPRIASRQFTRGAFTNGSPMVGTGTVNRLTVDENGLPLEAGIADVIRYECLQDRQSGANPGQEVFEVRGRPKFDELTSYDATLGGTGLRGTQRCFSADDTQSLLLNPSFSDVSGTDAVPTQINNWTVLAGNISMLSVIRQSTAAIDVYRGSTVEGTSPGPGALVMTAGALGTVTIQQLLANRRGALSTSAPYYFQIAFNAEINAASGVLTVTIGSQTYSVTVTGLTGWQLLKVTFDKYCYLKNFDVDNLPFNVSFAQGATGTGLVVDDIIWRTWLPYDGVWYAPVGARTPFLLRDTGTITDSELGSKIQRHISRAYSYCLPCAPETPVTGPTVALAGAGTGNVNNGAHTYAVTFRTADGNESAAFGANVATVVDKTVDGKVAVTAIAVGAAGHAITSRRLYRSAAGTTTPLKLLATLADNTTTTYTDNTADSGLGATAPTGITIADPT